MQRILVITSIGFLGLIITLAVVGARMRFSAAGENGRDVRVESVLRQELIERVSAPGEIEPNVKVDVSAEVSARILELPFREGEIVRKGDLIIRLSAEDIEARLESAKARRDAERYRLQSEQSRLAGPVARLAVDGRALAGLPHADEFGLEAPEGEGEGPPPGGGAPWLAMLEPEAGYVASLCALLPEAWPEPWPAAWWPPQSHVARKEAPRVMGANLGKSCYSPGNLEANAQTLETVRAGAASIVPRPRPK